MLKDRLGRWFSHFYSLASGNPFYSSFCKILRYIITHMILQYMFGLTLQSVSQVWNHAKDFKKFLQSSGASGAAAWMWILGAHWQGEESPCRFCRKMQDWRPLDSSSHRRSEKRCRTLHHPTLQRETTEQSGLLHSNQTHLVTLCLCQCQASQSCHQPCLLVDQDS